jgi:hypothetical protein
MLSKLSKLSKFMLDFNGTPLSISSRLNQITQLFGHLILIKKRENSKQVYGLSRQNRIFPTFLGHYIKLIFRKNTNYTKKSLELMFFLYTFDL